MMQHADYTHRPLGLPLDIDPTGLRAGPWDLHFNKLCECFNAQHMSTSMKQAEKEEAFPDSQMGLGVAGCCPGTDW